MNEMPTKRTDNPDEQLQLIDVDHPLAKELKPLCRKYKEALKERMGWLRIEIEQKHNILELVHSDKSIKPGEDGVTKLSFDGMTIKITPRDEVVRVKFDDADDEDAEGGG